LSKKHVTKFMLATRLTCPIRLINHRLNDSTPRVDKPIHNNSQIY